VLCAEDLQYSRRQITDGLQKVRPVSISKCVASRSNPFNITLAVSRIEYAESLVVALAPPRVYYFVKFIHRSLPETGPHGQDDLASVNMHPTRRC
jgi:hypothetical protein